MDWCGQFAVGDAATLLLSRSAIQHSAFVTISKRKTTFVAIAISITLSIIIPPVLCKLSLVNMGKISQMLCVETWGGFVWIVQDSGVGSTWGVCSM